MASPLLSDSCGVTPVKKSDRKNQTTRFYGVGFIKGKLKDNCSQLVEDSNYLNQGKSVLFDTYGCFLCGLLAISILAITLGVSLALAGHLTQKKSLQAFTTGNHTKHTQVHLVLRYNHMLESFVLSGMVLLAVGISLFIFLMIIPFCSGYEVSIRKYQEYNLAPNSDSEDGIVVNKVVSSGRESVTIGIDHESPAKNFASMHQLLKPTNGNNPSLNLD